MKRGRGRRSKSIQAKWRKTHFSFDQYWQAHFTINFNDGSEKDFKSILKARSAKLAKNILKSKIKSDHPGSKLKSDLYFMLHKNAEINQHTLTIEDWQHVKKCCFPNEVNVLFKYFIPRPEGYTNRFNAQSSPHVKTGFIKGADARRRQGDKKYSKEEKAHLIYDGKLKPWPKQERDALKEKVIIALKLNNNNRSKAAKYLGYTSSRPLRRLMVEKFIEVDWEKDFPILERGGRCITPDQRIAMTIARQKMSVNKIKSLKDKINPLLSSGVPKYKVCQILKISKQFLKKCIDYYESN